MTDSVDRAEGTEADTGILRPLPARKLLVIARFLALGLLGTLMLRIAWISDDSLITLRTALNLSHGWGPGFNATESVQAYTHPLWFLLWLIGGIVSREWIVTVVILSVTCSVAAAAIVLWNARSVASVVLAASALGLSNAFMEYTTSALENPLAYLLLGALLALSLRHHDAASRLESGPSLLLGITLSGVALTRLDLLLIALPAALLFVWRARTNRRLLFAATLGFMLPLIAWFAWSYATYQTLLPNTFAAKRNLLIPPAELVVQGVRYFWVSIEHDPVTGLILTAGLLTTLVGGSILQRGWAGGVVLYLAYVVYIGGDFMAGRFLAVPVYLVTLLAVTSPLLDEFDASEARQSLGCVHSGRIAGASIAVMATVLVLVAAGRVPVALLNPVAQRWEYEQAAGVADERGFYTERSRGIGQWLMSLGTLGSVPPFQNVGQTNAFAPLSDLRAAANDWPRKDTSFGALPHEVGVKCGLLGAVGILTGPGVHWVDSCALTDRFLAEQRYRARGLRWRVGHYMRRPPDGYVDAIAHNDPSLVTDSAQSERLAELWSRIRN